LKSLPVDFLKIDGQFVRRIADDPVDRSMVEAVCQVARTLNIETVAECVEVQPVLDELGRIGIDYAQGFFVAQPQPIAQLQP
jgi:Amt family ammonium transporter